MSLVIEGAAARDLSRTTQLEWLETNGLGGWAASSVCGAHSRRYHGLLVAATRPPVERTVLLSKLDERIRIDGRSHELGCNRFTGLDRPQGGEHLQRFERDLFPRWTYTAAGVRLQRTIAALDGENTTVVAWEVLDAPGPFELEIRPLVAARDFHALSSYGGRPPRTAEWEGDVLRLWAHDVFESREHTFYLGAAGAAFESGEDWWRNFHFAIEHERGFDANEDLWTPGVLRVELQAGARFAVLVSTIHPRGRDALALLARESERRHKLSAAAPAPARALALAADQFVVRRGSGLRTVIAGYHWFGDWGRDTMIALPGLCLATGRYEDARDILRAFAASVDRGMLPNRFPDRGEAPEYNTVDATLWFFLAIHKYLHATQDASFVRDELLPVLRDILAWHERGTRYGIRVDTDGLLLAGEPGVQLTWMDAKVGDHVVTPRHGKPVEVNALWINALRILADLETRLGDASAGTTLRSRSESLRGRFEAAYWNEEAGCLYDVVSALGPDTVPSHGDALAASPSHPSAPDASIRPNQLFALSLPYPLLSNAKALRVLDVVERRLLTPVGLRSLDPGDPMYRPRYEGDVWSRDTAYHQGTVWSWLLGPFITALVRYRGEDGRRQAFRLWEEAQAQLRAGLIGSVAEIYDAEPPHRPRGAAAQAWGVAELLRAWHEDLRPQTARTEHAEVA